MTPHMHLERTAKPPIDAWRCVPCGMTGTMRELQAIECAAVYPPCKVCGQTPECAPDCAGVLAALASVGVHVVGATTKTEAEIERVRERGVS